MLPVAGAGEDDECEGVFSHRGVSPKRESVDWGGVIANLEELIRDPIQGSGPLGSHSVSRPAPIHRDVTLTETFKRNREKQ
jgi:hypothetical protein